MLLGSHQGWRKTWTIIEPFFIRYPDVPNPSPTPSAQPTMTRTIISPDNKFEAVLVGVPKSGNDAHYQIRERGSERPIFTTRARYKNTPSDVKFASFSRDSQKFAAGYHYRNYTWINVYWVTTGLLDSSWKYDGWIRNFPMPR